jgi:hypothetical protein
LSLYLLFTDAYPYLQSPPFDDVALPAFVHIEAKSTDENILASTQISVHNNLETDSAAPLDDDGGLSGVDVSGVNITSSEADSINSNYSSSNVYTSEDIQLTPLSKNEKKSQEDIETMNLYLNIKKLAEKKKTTLAEKATFLLDKKELSVQQQQELENLLKEVDIINKHLETVGMVIIPLVLTTYR